MDTLEVMTEDMVLACLHESNIDYFRGQNGLFLIELGYDQESQCDIKSYISLDGDPVHTLAVRGRSSKRFSPDQWSLGVLLCNLWNSRYRWPKAFMVFPPDNETASVGIEVMENFDVSLGTIPAMVKNFLDRAVWGVYRFWQWVGEQQVKVPEVFNAVQVHEMLSENGSNNASSQFDAIEEPGSAESHDGEANP